MKAFEREMMVREEGRIEGANLRLISQVCKKLTKGCSVSEIAEILEEPTDTIQSICDAAAKYAPEYDTERIFSEVYWEL